MAHPLVNRSDAPMPCPERGDRAVDDTASYPAERYPAESYPAEALATCPLPGGA